MTFLLSIFLLVIGFIVLIKGADFLVDGASVIASRLGMSDLMIGLTIVAFGTSMPELLVNIIASAQGSNDIAIGNVIGSNIANTLLVLGIAASFSKLKVHTSTVWREIPFSILATVVIIALLNDTFFDGYQSILSRVDGIILISFFIIFLYYTFSLKKEESQGKTKRTSLTLAFFYATIGIILLPIGGKITIDAAVNIATHLGLSEALIGLTIVALGTSLPEAVTAIIAVRKGKFDIAVGNVVGSNIFNIFWILGLSSIIRPIVFNVNLNVDLLIALLASVVLFFIVHRGPIHNRIRFWKQDGQKYNIMKHEGILLLATYFVYIVLISIRG